MSRQLSGSERGLDRRLLSLLLAGGLLVQALIPGGASAKPAPPRDIYVPSTVSAPQQAVLRGFRVSRPYATQLPAPADREGWRKLRDALEVAYEPRVKQAIRDNHVTVSASRMGGVPVLDIKPAGWTDDGTVLLYTHGGAYTLFSARSTLIAAAPMARASGRRVISVDYTPAPFADWRKIQAQVLAVVGALGDAGYKMEQIGILGDSAGGALATSTVLALRDRGLGMPAAVVLWSPWADLTGEGDTLHTLRDADPTLTYHGALENAAKAYANGLGLRDPRVSPVFADFSKGFPPTLIQESTKTIMLSTSVRLYRKLDEAGQGPVIDMYEGLQHVFQETPVPESKIAIRKSAAFFEAHLKRR